MRGRRPRPLTLARGDRAALRQVARSENSPWYQVRRARTVLAIADGERSCDVASRLECDEATVWRTCRLYERSGRPGPACWMDPSDRAARPRFPPLQRAQIVALACLEPVARGLHITHWSSDDLARQVVADGIIPSIGARTVRRILHEADLQPHRTRYWKTARLDDRFKERAEKVLWCHANAARLARRRIWVVCADEVPNFQALERIPIRRAVPGQIERQEFEYTRHGTVNILMFLVVHTGQMEAVCLDRNDADHYIEALRGFRRRHRLRGVYLVQDGGSSHAAAKTNGFFAEAQGWWQPRRTPAHASWLDQAELLIRAFSPRYLKRRSWISREQVIEQVEASWPEYNRLYAHPFEWTWSSQKMRQWFAKHKP